MTLERSGGETSRASSEGDMAKWEFLKDHSICLSRKAEIAVKTRRPSQSRFLVKAYTLHIIKNHFSVMSLSSVCSYCLWE